MSSAARVVGIGVFWQRRWPHQQSKRRARLVLRLMTPIGGSNVSVFSWLLRPTQPGHPSISSGKVKTYDNRPKAYCKQHIRECSH